MYCSQNYGDLFVNSLRKELYALECINIHTKSEEKKSKFKFVVFLQSR